MMVNACPGDFNTQTFLTERFGQGVRLDQSCPFTVLACPFASMTLRRPKSGHAFEQGQCIANRPTCWDLRSFAGLRVFATVLQVCARFAANSGTNKEHFSP